MKCILVDGDLKKIPDKSLVVCAGTVTVGEVANMGSGFMVFKKAFSSDNHWQNLLQQHLDNYFINNQDMPVYISAGEANGLIGGIATVPVKNGAKPLRGENEETQYKQAVRSAIQDAIGKKRPLYIQPLGIGVYNWPPKQAAQLFADVVEEFKQQDLQITIPIFNQVTNSNDKIFENEFAILMRQKNLSVDVSAPPSAPKPHASDNQFKSGEWLSDHAYQSKKFCDVSEALGQAKQSFELNVASYNLQDLCFSKSGGKSHANSPFPDYDESTEEYKKRKMSQIDQIVEKLKKGEDVLCLQEVDFLIPSKPEKETKIELSEYLSSRLNEIGYAIEFTKKPADRIANQKMAIIYNSKRFDVVAGSQQSVLPFVSESNSQNRGFEVTFKDKTTQKEVIITNLHLKYNHNYHPELENYQKSKQGKMHVMFGDCNNVQGEFLKTAIGDWKSATNVSLNKGGQLTIEHKKEKERVWLKAFDLSFASPSTGCYVTARSNPWSEQFKADEHGKIKLQLIDPSQTSRISRSRVGEHWRRGADIVRELLRKYQDSSNTQEKQKISTEILDVVKLKGLPEKILNEITSAGIVLPRKEGESIAQEGFFSETENLCKEFKGRLLQQKQMITEVKTVAQSGHNYTFSSSEDGEKTYATLTRAQAGVSDDAVISVQSFDVKQKICIDVMHMIGEVLAKGGDLNISSSDDYIKSFAKFYVGKINSSVKDAVHSNTEGFPNPTPVQHSEFEAVYKGYHEQMVGSWQPRRQAALEAKEPIVSISDSPKW